MKPHKNIWLRIVLGIAGIGVGLGVQLIGELVDKLIHVPISPRYSLGVLGFLFIYLGFAVMAYLVYKWAIK